MPGSGLSKTSAALAIAVALTPWPTTLHADEDSYVPDWHLSEQARVWEGPRPEFPPHAAGHECADCKHACSGAHPARHETHECSAYNASGTITTASNPLHYSCDTACPCLESESPDVQQSIRDENNDDMDPKGAGEEAEAAPD